MIEHLIPVLAGTLAAATPLIFAGLGELVAERTGVINLGVEGMMLIGAVAGFAAAGPEAPPLLLIDAPRDLFLLLPRGRDGAPRLRILEAGLGLQIIEARHRLAFFHDAAALPEPNDPQAPGHIRRHGHRDRQHRPQVAIGIDVASKLLLLHLDHRNGGARRGPRATR